MAKIYNNARLDYLAKTGAYREERKRIEETENKRQREDMAQRMRRAGETEGRIEQILGPK